eukprot:4637-Heterococcus_DN1.PRE.2
MRSLSSAAVLKSLASIAACSLGSEAAISSHSAMRSGGDSFISGATISGSCGGASSSASSIEELGASVSLRQALLPLLALLPLSAAVIEVAPPERTLHRAAALQPERCSCCNC